jgi:hypothetical protein
MTWYPPAGLPPGQFVTPDPEFSAATPGIDHALWTTDEPVPDAGEPWARLLRDHEDAGLWPLLLITMRPRGTAAEHLAHETPEAMVDGIDRPLSFEEYAARLSGGRTWWFWWD